MVDMSASNAWAEFAAIYRKTRGAFFEHERAKTELKGSQSLRAKGMGSILIPCHHAASSPRR